MSEFRVTEQNRVRRLAKRGQYDRETIYAIVDEAPVCHVGFVHDGKPVVIPTIHARVDDTILLHGAAGNRMLDHGKRGDPICITVTILDGIVLARSVFHSSMNYRSAVLFGTGRTIDADDEKLAALEAIAEHVARGRWKDARLPTKKELDATSVIAVDIESASAKIRTGPPVDDEEDYLLPVWAGVVPMQLAALPPVADPKLRGDIEAPSYARHYTRRPRA